MTELRPTRTVVDADVASPWFLQAADPSDEPAFAFNFQRSAGVSLAKTLLDVTGVVAVSGQWPPPSDATLLGIELRFKRGTSLIGDKSLEVYDDVGQIGLISGARGTSGARVARLPFVREACANRAQDGWSLRGDSQAVYGSLDSMLYAEPDGTPVNLAFVTDPCAFGVRIGLQFSSGAAGVLSRVGDLPDIWLHQAVSQLRIRVRYSVPPDMGTTVPLPPPTLGAPVWVSAQAGGIVASSPRVDDRNSYNALQGTPGGALGMPLFNAELPAGGILEMTIGAFGMARLPKRAIVTDIQVRNIARRRIFLLFFHFFYAKHCLSLQLSVDSAVLRTLSASVDNKFNDVRWLSVELVHGQEVLATAGDARNCGAKRRWPAENCRQGGSCFGTTLFAAWDKIPDIGKLASCDFAVRVTVERSKASEREGTLAEWSTRARAIAAPQSPGSAVAMLGAVLLRVRYQLPLEPPTYFSTRWNDGRVVTLGDMTLPTPLIQAFIGHQTAQVVVQVG